MYKKQAQDAIDKRTAWCNGGPIRKRTRSKVKLTLNIAYIGCELGCDGRPFRGWAVFILQRAVNEHAPILLLLDREWSPIASSIMNHTKTASPYNTVACARTSFGQLVIGLHHYGRCRRHRNWTPCGTPPSIFRKLMKIASILWILLPLWKWLTLQDGAHSLLILCCSFT